MSCFGFRIENWFGFAAMYMIKDCGDHWIFYRGRFRKIYPCVAVFLLINSVKFLIHPFHRKIKADFGQKSFENWMHERPTWWADATVVPKDEKIEIKRRKRHLKLGLGFISNKYYL